MMFCVGIVPESQAANIPILLNKYIFSGGVSGAQYGLQVHDAAEKLADGGE